MKILVTGSEGLIGTALCERLRSLNIKIIPYDIKFPSSHSYYGDILDRKRIELALEDCNGIIHLAGVSRVVWGQQNPELCWRANYEATVNIINTATSSHLKPWMLFASSREVYGRPRLLPATEETLCLPINIYGKSKAEAEKLIFAARQKGINTGVVRYSNVYGSIHDHHDRVIPAFCRAAAFGNPIKVEGSNNSFDFTYIDDVVEGTMKIVHFLMERKNDLPPLHLTTGRETSLLEAALLANKYGNQSSEIHEAEPRNYDVPNFYGDSTLTRTILGWEPKINIEEGIARLVKNFQEEVTFKQLIKT